MNIETPVQFVPQSTVYIFQFTKQYLPVYNLLTREMGFPGGLDSKESACNAEDLGSTPGLGDPLENGYPLQYSCLENSMDRGAWYL